MVNGNFAGINSTLINPSSLLHSKLYLDVNFATADLFLENNAFYIHKEDYRPIAYLRSSDNLPEYGKDDLPFDYYRNNKRKDFQLNMFVQGPSFSVVKGIHAYGFRSAFRTIFSSRAIPYEIIPFSYEGLDYEPQHNINYNDDIMLISGLSWMEYAVSYARSLYQHGPVSFSGGISLKLLLGVAGGYLDIENVDYIVHNDSTLSLRNVRGEFGLSSPVFPAESFINGTGMAMDIGVTYEKRSRGHSSWRSGKLCRQPYVDYNYRLGISVLDLGWVSFAQDARKHSYDDVGTYWEHIDTVIFRNIEQFTAMVSNELFGDPGASLSSSHIKVQLPTALSIQLDYHIQDQWYVNSTLILPARITKEYIYRPAQLAVTPRYETQYLELSMPFSLYDFRYPRFGLAARFWFVTLGTDNLLGFFNLTDFTGLDIYVSIKLNFLKGKCRPTGFRCER